MAAMVRHFGDLADSRNAVRHLRFLRAGRLRRAALPARRPRESGMRRAGSIEALRGAAHRPTGRLHTELFADGSMTRDDFEEVLGALARAGLVRLVSAVFEKDGKSIPYSKAA